jgi:hypothetical protein
MSIVEGSLLNISGHNFCRNFFVTIKKCDIISTIVTRERDFITLDINDKINLMCYRFEINILAQFYDIS